MNPFTLLGAILVLGSAGLAEAASFTLINSMPGTMVLTSSAAAVSADGSVVVGEARTYQGYQAYRWSNGIMEALPPLGPSPYLHIDSATGISADGQTISGYSYSPAAGGFEAVRWSNGVPVGLGDIPGYPFDSTATAVSADGSVVVGAGSPAANSYEAVRWSDGAMTRLGHLPVPPTNTSHPYSIANAVSADGSVVVGMSISGFGREPFRWADNQMLGLGFLPGSDDGEASAVSADGSAVAGTYRYAAGQEAFVWRNGSLIGLGDFGGPPEAEPYVDSRAAGMDATGRIVVGTARDNYASSAFVWTEAGGMQRLTDILSAQGAADLDGWELYEALAISADGRFVVGSAYRSGETFGYIAEIAPVPAPPALWLLTTALASGMLKGAGGRRRVLPAAR